MSIDFARNERSTVGVELELSLVDRETRSLVGAASELLADLGAAHPGGDHPKAKNELFECTLEIITGVCESPDQIRADLAGTLSEVRDAADARGLDVVSLATHPHSRWRDQRFSPSERYAELVREMQWTARRLLITGTHVHVGVRSPEKAVAFVNVLTSYIPHFLVLSASSPYWEGEDSGLASSRIKVFESLPTAGLPPHLEDWEDFEGLMATFLRAECVRSVREIWWDIRPHPDFGTVELRMCDAAPTLRENVAIAALAQTLVEWLDRQHDRGELPGRTQEWVVKENKWLAARHGIDAELIVDRLGHRRPVRDLLRELVDELAPVARDLGTDEYLDDVLAILEHQPGYVRQRRVTAAGGGPADVVDAMVRELETDQPGAR